MLRALIWLPAAACGSTAPQKTRAAAPPNAAPYVEPVVDMACVVRARDGKLADAVPTHAGSFTVTATPNSAHLHRDGRALTDAESDALWSGLGTSVFHGGGVAGGNAGRFSSDTCDDAPKAACFKLKVWVCQIDIPSLVERIERAATQAGLSDALLTVDVAFEEASGPACRDGARCKPVQHYSTNGTYDPDKSRHSEAPGMGTCANDADCVGADSNICSAWWLRGGMEFAVYEMRSVPTFCGCVEHRCGWFTQ